MLNRGSGLTSGGGLPRRPSTKSAEQQPEHDDHPETFGESVIAALASREAQLGIADSAPHTAMMSSLGSRLLGSRAPTATVWIRAATGIVFLGEGIQKFLYPDALGAGRFAKIGIPMPELMGPFVGIVETAGGALLLMGLLTRLAAAALIVDMLVAIASTKVPILIGQGYLGFAKPSVPKSGFWSMLHEARTDLSMLFCLVFLLLVGASSRSLDAVLLHRRNARMLPPGAVVSGRRGNV